jgi:Rieske oxygenase family protein
MVRAVISMRVQECNWLQALEGEIDSAHAPILHGRIDSKGQINEWLAKRDLRPTFECIRQDFGMSIAAKRQLGDEKLYWRVNQFVMPFYSLVPPQSKFPDLSGHAWVPMDDNHTLCIFFSYHPSEPLPSRTRELFEEGHNGRETGHPSKHAFVKRDATVPYADYWTNFTRENGYQFDYQSQVDTWFSGLPMRGDDPRCARRDRGVEGNRSALPRGGQAHLRSDRGLFTVNGGGPQDLHRTEGKDRRSGHDRQAKGETLAAPGWRVLTPSATCSPARRFHEHDGAKRPELADIAQIDRARLQRSAAHEGAQDRGQDHGVEKMPSRAWLSCTVVSRLICALDDRKTRARLDRLVRDGKIECKRGQGSHGPVYLFRRLS